MTDPESAVAASSWPGILSRATSVCRVWPDQMQKAVVVLGKLAVCSPVQTHGEQVAWSGEQRLRLCGSGSTPSTATV
jgi:hypothetical protein